MEKIRGPMDKNRITRPTRPDEQMIAKSAIIKSRGGKAGAVEVIIRAAISRGPRSE